MSLGWKSTREYLTHLSVWTSSSFCAARFPSTSQSFVCVVKCYTAFVVALDSDPWVGMILLYQCIPTLRVMPLTSVRPQEKHMFTKRTLNPKQLIWILVLLRGHNALGNKPLPGAGCVFSAGCVGAGHLVCLETRASGWRTAASSSDFTRALSYVHPRGFRACTGDLIALASW